MICSWVPFFVHAAHLERQWNTVFFFSYTVPYFKLSKQFQLIVANQKIIARPLQMFNTSMLAIIEIYLLSLRSSFLNTCWLTFLARHLSKRERSVLKHLWLSKLRQAHPHKFTTHWKINKWAVVKPYILLFSLNIFYVILNIINTHSWPW